MRSAWSVAWGLVPLGLAMLPVGWFLWNWLKRSDEPLTLLVRWVISAITLGFVLTYAARAHDEAAKIAGLILGLFGGLVMTLVWRQRFCDWVGDKITSLYTGGQQQAEPVPLYSFAEARRKKGDYVKAIEEVQAQLALFPTDFQGWMLLAEIYASDLKDLERAREALDQVLAQPGHGAKNIAYALNRLADWQLKLAQDRDAARIALEQIVERLPDTEQAQYAFQRIAHLAPETPRNRGSDAVPVPLPHHPGRLGLSDHSAAGASVEEDPAVTAGKYVKHLEEFPFDSDAREKLALLYARHYRRLDLAADQLEQLIAFPNQPPKQVVHWINLLADLQIDFGQDAEGSKVTLQRIVDLFPKSAAAENALNRMARVNLEIRGKQQRQAVKLGSYEQNIGLKSRVPPPP